MNTNRLLLKAVFLLILLSAACTSVLPNADRDEGQAVVSSKASDADMKEARSALDSKDYAKAIHLLSPLAEQGNPKAQYGLGAIYADGLGVNRDYSEAAKWFRKSAEQGYPHAQTALGTLYGRGDGVPQDSAEAMKWYRKAAEQGDPDAQRRLGAMYMNGEGVPKDYVEAEQWFRKAAAQGHPHGQLWLGRLYLEGWSVSQNLAEAAKWYKLAIDQFRRAGIAVEETEAAEGTSASALLLKALAASPELLALSYLSVSHDLKLAEKARNSETFHFAWHARKGGGKPEIIEIDKSNAASLVAVLKERLDIYSHAITQRGFQQLAHAYDTAVSTGCHTLGFSSGTAVIAQEAFEFHLAHRLFQVDMRHQGVIVESALALEYAVQPEIHFVGHIQQERIELKPAQFGPQPAQLDCVVTLLIASAELPPSMGVSVSGAPPQTSQTAYERLGFEFEPGWKVGYEAEFPHQGSITEFIREGDDINNWKELLTIHNFPTSWGGSFPEDTLNMLKAIRERKCPGVIKWNVIGKDEKSILYEWQAKPCLGWPDQHEIARIIYGKYNRFHLRYTVKVYQMPPEERTHWIKWLLEAKAIAAAPTSPKTEETTEKELDKLQGTWIHIGGEEEGRQQDEVGVKTLQLSLTIHQDQFQTRIFSSPGPGGTIKLYPTTTPKGIDFTFQYGPLSGKTRLGIYEVEGDRLKICGNAPGKEGRPKEFKTEKGDNFALDVFKRQ